MPLTRTEMAEAVARDIPEGWYVNLGIGIPALVADYVPSDRDVVFRSENGVLGFGPAPEEDAIGRWLINAGKSPPEITHAYRADSFATIRGGHPDLCVLGAFEVAENGDLANSTSETDSAPVVGGAMDPAVVAKRLWAVMEHTTTDGRPRLVRGCGYPLTAPTAVSRVYTNLAVLDVTEDGFAVRELAPGVDFETVQAKTDAKLTDARVLAG